MYEIRQQQSHPSLIRISHSCSKMLLPIYTVQPKMNYFLLLFLPSNGFLEMGLAVVHWMSVPCFRFIGQFFWARNRGMCTPEHLCLVIIVQIFYICFQFFHNKIFSKVLICKCPRENPMFMGGIRSGGLRVPEDRGWVSSAVGSTLQNQGGNRVGSREIPVQWMKTRMMKQLNQFVDLIIH